MQWIASEDSELLGRLLARGGPDSGRLGRRDWRLLAGIRCPGSRKARWRNILVGSPSRGAGALLAAALLAALPALEKHIIRPAPTLVEPSGEGEQIHLLPVLPASIPSDLRRPCGSGGGEGIKERGYTIAHAIPKLDVAASHPLELNEQLPPRQRLVVV